MPESVEEQPHPQRDPEQGRLIRRWLRIADEFVRRSNGKKGGARETGQHARPDDGRGREG